MGEANLHGILISLSAPIPSPAAGSAAALTAAVGASLLVMIANIAAKRLPLGPERAGIVAIGAKAGRMREMLEDVYEQDAEAYRRVVEVRRQPPGPERDELLGRAWKTATLVPGAMGRAAMICLRLAGDLAPKTPAIAAPDVGTAALLCHAAVQASLLVVHRNLTHVADKAFCEKILRNQSFLDDRDALLETVLQFTHLAIT